jgi:hypothetical protein
MPDIADPGAHGAEHMLSGQRALARGVLPSVEHEHHPDKRCRVEPEHRLRSGGGDDEAAQSRADGARQVDADAAQRHGRRQLLAGHQFGRDGLPGRRGHGGAQAEREGERQQKPGCDGSHQRQCA